MTISLKFNELRDGQAVFSDDSGRFFYWPADKAPSDLVVGAVYFFSIHPQRDLSSYNQELAQDILKEVLKADQPEN